MKSSFDFIASVLGLIILSPIFIIISLLIKFDSPGPIFYRGERVGLNGKKFKILKFRTMVQNAEKIGASSTSEEDPRLTRIGKILRKYKLDEFPQLINILKGEMSFVGTRPEVPEYVKLYDNEMLATLLLPAGITSFASIEYKNEAELLNGVNIDDIYINKILPEKMKINLKYLNDISILQDIKIMLKTII